MSRRDTNGRTMYDTKEKCIPDLLLAREVFGNKRTTEVQYDAMQNSLGMMFLHCPEEVRTLVESTLDESMRRRAYYELGPWLKSELEANHTTQEQAP